VRRVQRLQLPENLQESVSYLCHPDLRADGYPSFVSVLAAARPDDRQRTQGYGAVDSLFVSVRVIVSGRGVPSPQVLGSRCQVSLLPLGNRCVVVDFFGKEIAEIRIGVVCIAESNRQLVQTTLGPQVGAAHSVWGNRFALCVDGRSYVFLLQRIGDDVWAFVVVHELALPEH